MNDRGGGHHDFEAPLQDQLVLMFLGGAGGTGNSRVIDAISAFCVSWHRESELVKTALTGKAATLIGARTLASFLVRIEHAIQENAFTTLDALVIDEVSMMLKPDWLKLDKLLRRYKQVPGVPFGGVHIVLVGDFLQMSPVGADMIFVDPANKPRLSTADIEGFELWRQFSAVVVLEESMRFRSDPEWAQGYAKARVGDWTPAFMDIVNSRVVHPSDADVEAGLALHSSVFVTDTIVQLSSQPPDYALLSLPRPRAVPIRASMDAELFPVFFATEPFKKSKISLPPAPDCQRRYLEEKLQQLPFVCAVGSTVYKYKARPSMIWSWSNGRRPTTSSTSCRKVICWSRA